MGDPTGPESESVSVESTSDSNPAPTDSGPQTDAPQSDAPKPKGAGPKRGTKRARGSSVSDTLPKKKKPGEKEPDNKEKSWAASMNDLAQGYSNTVVKPVNDFITRGVFGATAQDWWDNPNKAGKATSDKIEGGLRSVVNGVTSAKDAVVGFASKFGKGKGDSPAPEADKPEAEKPQVKTPGKDDEAIQVQTADLPPAKMTAMADAVVSPGTGKDLEDVDDSALQVGSPQSTAPSPLAQAVAKDEEDEENENDDSMSLH